MYHHSDSASLSHVVCLFLAILVRVGAEETPCRSDLSPPCMGGRPPLFTGCCPLGAWHTCQPSRDLSCDRELGLFCTNPEGSLVLNDEEGTCQGDFSLQAIYLEETTVDLEWLNFAPPNYPFEYVVLQREGSYHQDISQWTIREMGRQPGCRLEQLKPATVYFLKVAIWADARAGVLGKTTETIVVQTLTTDVCEFDGEFFLVGQQVINGCEENCTCLATGEFRCSPLCQPHGLPEVEEGCHVIQGDTCCDFKTSCPVGGEPCVIGNLTFPHGAEFEQRCRQCRCTHGHSECYYPEGCGEMAPTADCPRPEKVETEGQCCPEWRCEERHDDACHHEDQDYESGEYFSSHTCGLCQCHETDGVRCSPDCPPVVMVLPSIECPDPQIRRDGCCDTLYCNYSNMSLPQFIGRMFAQSYSPVSLTVSFEANPVAEDSEYPLYSQYEILFANSSDPLMTWHRRLVQPVDVRLRKDRAGQGRLSTLAAPIEALTRDNAIVVGERVYISLSGMDPDTMYYVRVTALVDSFPSMMDGELGGKGDNPAHMPTIAVTTMPLDNVSSCFYEGRQIHHGQMAKVTCSESCQCMFGRVTCASSCQAELVVLARSPSCPQPRLERVEGQCCPEWKCYPSVTGCLYDGVILSSGQSVTRGCDVCTCHDTSVTCEPTCQAVDDVHYPPRAGCVLSNVTGQCCPHWTCPRESHPAYGVKTSILLYLNGKCSSHVTSFTQDLEKRVLNQAVSVCLENHSGLNNYCSGLKAKVQCLHNGSNTSLKSQSRQKRQAKSALTAAPTLATYDGTIKVQIFLSANFSQESPNALTEELLQSAGLQLAGRLNRSLELLSSDGEVLQMVQVSSVPHISYICDPGFSFERGHCVLSEVETPLTTPSGPTLAASDVTDTLAVLTWALLSQRALEHVTGLMLEYRQEGHVQWVPGVRLPATRSSCLLRSLVPEQNYTVQLVASTTWPGQRRWVMAQVTLKTLQRAQGHSSSILSLRKVTLFPDSAVVHWDEIPEEVASTVLSAEIHWRRAYEKAFSYRYKVRELHKNFVRIPDLTEDTTYTAEIILLLTTGSTIKSTQVHFVTKSRKESLFHELLIAVSVGAALGLLVGALLTVVCVVWRHSKGRASVGGFVNKTFGIQISNRKREGTSAANPGVI